MAANNEIGTLQPIARDRRHRARAHGALFHTDAAQAAGKIPIDVRAMGIDLLSLTGHKFYGPKGCGALFVRRRSRSCCSRRRSTAAARKTACARARSTSPASSASAARRRSAGSRWRTRSPRLAALRDRLLEGCARGSHDVRVNGTLERRLPHNLHVSFDGVEGEALLMALGDLAVSTGSACAPAARRRRTCSRRSAPSARRAGASIRFGLGRATTDRDIDFAAERVIAVVNALRR